MIEYYLIYKYYFYKICSKETRKTEFDKMSYDQNGFYSSL